MPVELTAATIAMIAGSVLSLLFSYIPGLAEKFAALPATTKRLVMLGLILVVTAAIQALSCAGVFQTGIACDKAGIVQVILIFLSAVIANQATYTVSPVTTSVQVAKDSRKLP